jgi:hypothetical protein
VELINAWFDKRPTTIFLDSYYHFDDLSNDYVNVRISKYGDNLFNFFNNTITKINRVVESAKEGALIRVWYAHNAKDLCGLMNLLYRLKDIECDIIELELDDEIYLINGSKEGNQRYWGRLHPNSLCIPISQAKLMSKENKSKYIEQWDCLVKENSEYRIYENGELKSVDHEYMKQIAKKHFPKKKFALTALLSKLMTKEEAFMDTCVNHVFPQFILRMVDEGVLENLGKRPNLFVDYWLMSKENK